MTFWVVFHRKVHLFFMLPFFLPLVWFICVMDKDIRKEIIEYLNFECKKHHIQIVTGNISDHNYDIYLPDLNCCIIIHTIGNFIIEPTTSNKNQFNEVRHEIKFVNVWEDQWTFQRDKIVSKFKSLLGVTRRIHGRETELIRIDNRKLIDFLAINHLNVPIKGKYKFGLICEKDLVAVMSFSKSREMVRDEVTYNSYELLRFCNKLNITVVGGFSKLLNHFIKLYDPDDIMTYADADWSDGEYYLNMGFEFIDKTPAIEFWLNMKTGIREYPHRVLDKYNLPADILYSEKEKSVFLESYGYYQVFNSGSYKYLLKRK